VSRPVSPPPSRRHFALDFPGRSRNTSRPTGIAPIKKEAMQQIHWCHHQPETKPTLMRRVSRFDLRYGV
jgi:hypothetical protein